MNVLDYIQRDGQKIIPNPKYNPRSKKNKEPKYITVDDTNGEETDPIVRGLKDNINDSYALPQEVLEQYSKHGITYNPRVHQNLDYEIADAQSNWTKLGNSLVQTLSEVGLGTVQSFTDLPSAIGGGLGQLIDGILGDVFNVKGNPVQAALGINEDNPYSNAVSDTIQQWRDSIQNEIAPIHVTPGLDIDNGGLGNVGWYLQGLPNLASTLTLLLPTKAVTGAIGLATKGLRAVNTARKTEKIIEQANKAKTLAALAKSEEASRVANELSRFERFRYNPIYQARAKRAATDFGEGLVMRTIENYQEAHQTYQDMYATASDKLANMNSVEYSDFIKDNEEELTAAGIDVTNKDQVAKWVAKQAADRTFKLDYANLLFDVIQLHSVRGIGKTSKKVTSPSIKRAERKLKEEFGKSSEELAKEEAKSRLKEFGHTIVDYTTGGAKKVLSEASEGIEEAINYIAQQEGITYGNTLLEGETDSTRDSFWNKRLREYLNNSELHESAFWGVAGGVVFGKFAGYYNRIQQYRAERERENLRKENKATGEKIETAVDASNPLSDFIRLSEMPEIKAAKEAINRRGGRAEQLFKDLEDIKDGKDPFNDRKDFEGDKEISAALARAKVIQEWRYEMAMDAINSGTYDSLIDWLNDKRVQQVFGTNIEDGQAFIAETIQDLETAKNAYNTELSNVNYQVAALNARRGDRDKIPLEYVQIIARNNAQRRLELHGLDRQIANLEAQEAGELEHTNMQMNESMDVRKIVRMSMLADRYGRLEADKRLVKEDKELSPWRKADSLKDIESEQDAIIKMIMDENIVPDIKATLQENESQSEANRARALGVALHTVRMAKAYRNIRTKINNKVIDDYRLDATDKDYAKSDEDLIKEYDYIFKGAKVSTATIGQLSKVFNDELVRLTGQEGLIKQNKHLYDLYANLAVLENQRAITASSINSNESQVLHAVNRLHNERNQVRKDMIAKAEKTIRQLHDKYKDTAAKDIEQAIAAAYMQDPEQATRIARERLTGTDDDGNRDSEKLISALSILNFSQGSNAEVLWAIGTILQENSEKHKAEREKNTVNQNQSSEIQKVVTNNVSAEQENAPTEEPMPSSDDSQAQTDQETQPEQEAQPDNTSPTIVDSTITDIDTSSNTTNFQVDIADGLVVGVKGSMNPDNPILAKVTKDGRNVTYELLVSQLPAEKQTAFILSDLFNHIEDDILNDKVALRVIKNPVTAPNPGYQKIIEKGDVELINTETGEVIDTTNPSISFTGEVTETTPATVTPTPVVADDTSETDNGPTTDTGLGDLQKDMIIEEGIGQFLNITMKDPNYAEAAASAKEYILGKYPDKLTEDEIDSLLAAKITEFKNALDVLSQLEGTTLEKEADKLAFSARYEESSTNNVSNMFKSAAESFIKTYAEEYLMPVYDGKQLVRLRDILNICNQRAKTEGNATAKAMYSTVTSYLLSPEGKAKYIVADEADVINNKILNSIGKTTDELITENSEQYEQRCDIDVYRDSATQTSDTAWFETINKLRVGDTLTATNEKEIKRHNGGKGWKLVFRKNGVIVASMPVPYEDGNGGYYWYNEGWLTDVHLEDDDPAGDFLDLIRRIFVPDKKDADALDLRKIIWDESLHRDKNGRINVSPEIIQKFSENNIIKELLKQSIDGPGRNKLYIDFNTKQPDYPNLIRHLRKLSDYSLSCIGSDNSLTPTDAIRESLEHWCMMLYNNYANIRRQPLVQDKRVTSIEVPITEITDGGINTIVGKPNEGEDVYDKLLPVKLAIAPGQSARIAIVDPQLDSAIVISPESGEEKDAFNTQDGFNAAMTLLALYDRNNTPYYITAVGTRLTDDILKKEPNWSKIHKTISDNIQKLVKDIQDKQDVESLNNLEKFLNSLIVTPNTASNVVPLLRAHHGMFHINHLSNDDWDGISISFMGKDGSYSDAGVFSRTKKGGFGYRAEHGKVTGAKNSEIQATYAILNFIYAHAAINIDFKGILADSNGTITGGFIRKELDNDNKARIIIDIPGSTPYREEYDSYNDFLLNNNFVRVDTYYEGESNFSAQGENQAANQVLRVELPDMIGTSSPVEENNGDSDSAIDTNLTASDSDKQTYSDIQQIFEANKQNAGLEVFRYLKGDDVVDRLNQILKEVGIEEGFDVFIGNLEYNRYYNYKTTDPETGKTVDGGFIATTNVSNEVADVKYYPRGAARIGGVDVRSTTRLQPKTAIFGFKLLNMLSSKDELRRNRGLRKLMHERIHLMIHDPNITPDRQKVLNAIKKVYTLYTRELELAKARAELAIRTLEQIPEESRKEDDIDAINKYKAQLNDFNKVSSLFNSLGEDTLLEEFIVEGMTNHQLYGVMNVLDYQQGSDSYLDNIPQGENKSIFAKFMDLIFKLFNWKISDDIGPVRRDSIYEKFYETLSNVFNEQEEQIKEPKPKEPEESEVKDESPIDDPSAGFDLFDAREEEDNTEIEENIIETEGYSMIPNMGVIRRNLPVEQRFNFDNLVKSGIVTYKCS